MTIISLNEILDKPQELLLSESENALTIEIASDKSRILTLPDVNELIKPDN